MVCDPLAGPHRDPQAANGTPLFSPFSGEVTRWFRTGETVSSGEGVLLRLTEDGGFDVIDRLDFGD